MQVTQAVVMQQARWREASRVVLPIYVGTRLLLQLVGMVTLGVSRGEWLHLWRLSEWFAIWARWDSEHYLRIAGEGYAVERLTAFFPAYPLLLRWLAFGRNERTTMLIIGVVISTASTIFALLLLYRFVASNFDSSTAQVTVTLYCIVPTSFFLSAVYTEGLFFLLAMVALYGIQSQRWLVATIAASLAIVTRVVGVAVAAMVVASFLQSGRKAARAWLPLGLLPLSLVALLLFEWQVLGHPLAFTTVQDTFGRTTGGSILDQLVFVLTLLFLWHVWQTQPAAHTLYMAVGLAIPLASLSLTSLARYALLYFPVFIAAASLPIVQRYRYVVYAGGFAMQLALFARWALNLWLA